MTEEVVRRFASQAEAIDYVLDHGLSRAEASYLSDEGWAIVEAKRMRRGLLQPKAAVARSRADLERDEIAALRAAKPKPAEATQPEPQPEVAPPAPPKEEEASWRKLGRRSAPLIEGTVEKAEEAFSSPPTQPEVVTQPAEGSRELVVSKPTLPELLTEVASEVEMAVSLAGTAKIVDPALVLSLMNERHAVVGNIGGKCRVVDWVPSELDPDALVAVFQTKADFINRYSNRQFGWKKGEPMTLGQWWFEHPKRADYRGAVFKPGKPAVISRGDWGII